MKKKLMIMGGLFAFVIVFTFNLGIFQNPSFSVYEFCASLSTEFIGWMFAVTLFQSYFDAKVKWKQTAHTSGNIAGSPADELLKLKSLLEDGVLSQEEFETLKRRLLAA